MKRNLPSLLFSFLLLIGHVPELSKNILLRKLSLVFPFLLLSQILDMLAMCIISFKKGVTLKNDATYIFSLFCNLMIWHSLRRRNSHLMDILRKFEKLGPVTHNRITNIIMSILLSLPFIFSVTSTLVCNRARASMFYAYGYELKSPILQAGVICIKKFLLFLVHSTFPSLVTVLFCNLCLRCSFCYNSATQKVLHYSSEEFGTLEQIEILRQKAKIDDILENLQEIFSTPSFCVIISNLFTCCSILGMYFTGNNLKCTEVRAVFYGAPNLVSLIILLWVAGGLPVEQNKLNGAFYKRTHSRFLIVLTSEEQQCKREMLDKTIVVLNGCSTFSYTRSSILALIGSLLTYSLLIYQN
ncbi:uncharacterized protein TNIN_279451 [Trichonephila inaurata madagascariensis]|uniref:Uncharacterized protein n=1 Tax=Trichonephila inaurata madagascariensis TaxID=2747483 RepID=A0A8X6MHW6_9ARAC|nr:uncharacterized protein TNIN_279451 [Trichonephila inaurata madagascariensis]